MIDFKNSSNAITVIFPHKLRRKRKNIGLDYDWLALVYLHIPLDIYLFINKNEKNDQSCWKSSWL